MRIELTIVPANGDPAAPKQRRGGRRLLAVGTLFATVFALSGIALATIPGPNGVFDGCYKKSSGALRVIDPSTGQSCSKKENAITWDQAGIDWMGAWDGGASYAVHDAVSYDGSSYVAIDANTGEAPDSGADWNLLASQGSQGVPGDPGAPGDQGPPGDPGPPGPSGVSNAYSGFGTVHHALQFGNPTLVVVTNALPGGSYVVNATITVYNGGLSGTSSSFGCFIAPLSYHDNDGFGAGEVVPGQSYGSVSVTDEWRYVGANDVMGVYCTEAMGAGFTFQYGALNAVQIQNLDVHFG